MVFVTAVRDYIDFINDNLATLGQGMSTPQIVQQTALYVVESCKLALLYIVTLQWLRDFTYLPILIPKYTGLIYKEALVLAGDPSLNIFTFGETPTIVSLHASLFLVRISSPCAAFIFKVGPWH